MASEKYALPHNSSGDAHHARVARTPNHYLQSVYFSAGTTNVSIKTIRQRILIALYEPCQTANFVSKSLRGGMDLTNGDISTKFGVINAASKPP
jgi:hypothetical protein